MTTTTVQNLQEEVTKPPNKRFKIVADADEFSENHIAKNQFGLKKDFIKNVEECHEPSKKQKEKDESERVSYEMLKDTMQRLGLKTDVLEYVENCQEILEGHQTDLYHTMYFIEDRLDSEELNSTQATTKKKLEYAGFEERIAAEFEKLDDDETFNHQSLLYWIIFYLKENWYIKTPTDETQNTEPIAWPTHPRRNINDKHKLSILA